MNNDRPTRRRIGTQKEIPGTVPDSIEDLMVGPEGIVPARDKAKPSRGANQQIESPI
jgi:hypothetical protein